MPKVFGPKGELKPSEELAAQVDQLAEKITGEKAKTPAREQAQEPAPRPAPNPKPRPRPVSTAAAPTNGNPFRKLGTTKRLKVLLWGDTGTGKTVLSLAFPAPCVIDMERGTEPYAGKFKFETFPTTDANAAMDAVKWLIANKHGYKTLVVDPITVYWESLQKKWSDIFLSRRKDSKGYKHEFYDLQPKDWMTLKSEWKEFIRFLTALDMNVVVTARQKAQYADSGYMQRIGETFDGERTLPYLFDVIVRLFRRDTKYMAEAIKDRFQLLPKEPFPATYEAFATAFGATQLERDAKPIAFATAEQVATLRELATEYGISDATLASRVRGYGAESVEELTANDAATIIKKIEAALKAREQSFLKE